MVNRQKHGTARNIVSGALQRWNAVERIEHEGDAGLIVDGAVLDELDDLAMAVGKLASLPDAVSKLADAVEVLAQQRGTNPPSGSGINIHIGPKMAGTVIAALVLALGGSAWWVGPVG